MAKGEVIIGLDLGSRTGFAVLLGARRLTSGRWSLVSARKGWHRAERWLDFEQYVTDLFMDNARRDRACVIAYERVRRHVGTGAAHVYGGFLSSMERLDFTFARMETDFGVRPEMMPIEVGTWKKATTGNGAALKTDVMQFAKSRWRYSTTDDNEADALAIAEAARRIRTGKYTP